MFRLYKRSEIDNAKWDRCIGASSQNIVYGLSWYLDTVAPHWEALILEEKDAYLAVFPIPCKKFIFKYVYQPFFTQQLGLFSLPGLQDLDLLAEVIRLLKGRYLKVNYQFNCGNFLPLSQADQGGIKSRRTHHLSLLPSYEELLKKFSTNLKRNLVKAGKNKLIIHKGTDIKTLIKIFQEDLGEKVDSLKDKNYKVLESIYKETESRGQALLLFAEDEHREVVSAGFFIIHGDKIIYLFEASTGRGKNVGAMSLIFNQVIKQYSGRNIILDFEGSELEGIARFYKSFGAEEIFYNTIALKKY